jgi:hypothetical protein
MGVITNKSDAIKVIEIETIIKNNKGSVIVSGNAKVKVREK